MRIIFLFIIILPYTSFASTTKEPMTYKEIKQAYLKSYQYEKMQNYRDAIKALSIVSYNYPKTFTVNLRLGYLYLLFNKYANAITHYERAQSIIPAALSPKLGLMSIAIKQGQLSKAEQIGFQIIKQDYYNYYGNLKLAYVYLQLKKLIPAQNIINKMLGLYPTNRAFLIQLAKLYELQHNLAAAQSTYKNILILDPENFWAKKFLSEHKKRGK